MVLSFIVLIVLIVVKVKLGARIKKHEDIDAESGVFLTCLKDGSKVCTKSLYPPDNVGKGLRYNNLNSVRDCCMNKDYVRKSVEKD